MLRRVCPYMLRAVQYVVLKANTLPGIQNWLGIRISYGMNGVVLPSEDIQLFVAALRANVTRKPPDLIWQTWAAGKHRPPVRAPGEHVLSIFIAWLLDASRACATTVVHHAG